MIAIPATSVTIFGPPAGWEVLPVCVSTSAGSRHFGKCIYIYLFGVYVSADAMASGSRNNCIGHKKNRKPQQQQQQQQQ